MDCIKGKIDLVRFADNIFILAEFRNALLIITDIDSMLAEKLI